MKVHGPFGQTLYPRPRALDPKPPLRFSSSTLFALFLFGLPYEKKSSRKKGTLIIIILLLTVGITVTRIILIIIIVIKGLLRDLVSEYVLCKELESLGSLVKRTRGLTPECRRCSQSKKHGIDFVITASSAFGFRV